MPGYAFLGYHYATAKVQFFLLTQDHIVCINSGYTISLIDRISLLDNLLGITICKMPTSMIVKRLDERKYSGNKYIRLNLYIPGYRNC